MKKIEIDKVTLNIGAGEPGDKLEKAMKLLSSISNAKPVQTKSKTRIPTWGIRPGLPIGCKVTLRKERANLLLKRLLKAMNNKISRKKFDKFGNLSFGIKEYIEIPEIKYDPTIGIIGLEVAVTLKRPGYRIKNRSVRKTDIGIKHIITKDDAIKFIAEGYGVEVVD
ncbi:50S ribosomal protein L5 [Candidatus Woesearchaeota archaeon]|nr:50S ribosomal protein L5 [Candidatus Woesearchaeota archaeon]